MRSSLSKWISDADALHHLEGFGVGQASLEFSHISAHFDDYYTSLVGELFDAMRTGFKERSDWARLANAFAQFAEISRQPDVKRFGINTDEAVLFAAAAFYCGGYPASACVVLRGRGASFESETYRACYDLLARPRTPRSNTVSNLLKALRTGDLDSIEFALESTKLSVARAHQIGPSAWVPQRLLLACIQKFFETNVRSVLPNGSDSFWNRLVASFLDRDQPVWDFFPSQIEAIERGLISNSGTFALQMPTGAGKTALCETLLFWQVRQNEDDAAVLLVPYRSLASELRATVVKRLNQMGISARCAYGGTVPSGVEAREIQETKVVVATPEAFSGVLVAAHEFAERISLVICDEGHLLDGESRGVGLELLLARLKAREGGKPRFVFVSAIVPNIEEINAWLGGTPESVVRSDYKPAMADFSVLRPIGNGASTRVGLDMHPHEAPPTRYLIESFLSRSDFIFTNPSTRRSNVLDFSSKKRQSIAAARKALPIGASAVFAANKHGDQGAVGLAEELLSQIEKPLGLPRPIDFADLDAINLAVDYLSREYGPDWVGTKSLAAGAVLHHGDIPQETREIVEKLVRENRVRLTICTSTLAEGVNFPIRTLVLYSVRRRQKDGRTVDLLARDIKNLVGRAGRAGSTTKGLVICANHEQWPLVEAVARQSPGEPVRGYLRRLVSALQEHLHSTKDSLSNSMLERFTNLYSMLDGIDSTLIDLMVEEIDEESLVKAAVQLADQTFASSYRQATAESKVLLQRVFELRARRVFAVKVAGRLNWIRDTGARVRMLDLVENGLHSMLDSWDTIEDPVDPELTRTMLDWAWPQGDMQEAVRDAFRRDDSLSVDDLRPTLETILTMWLAGRSFADISTSVGLTVDKVLIVYTAVISFVLQTIVEQGVSLLAKLFEAEERLLSPAVASFPDHLRFGLPTPAGRNLMKLGVRHRRAAFALSQHPSIRDFPPQNRGAVSKEALLILESEPDVWVDRLGSLVFKNTIDDLRLDSRTALEGDPDLQT